MTLPLRRWERVSVRSRKQPAMDFPGAMPQPESANERRRGWHCAYMVRRMLRTYEKPRHRASRGRAMNLSDWRRRIDEIDSKLVELLNARSRCALEIGKLKQA